MAPALRVIAVKAEFVVAPLSVYAPVSVVRGPSAAVGWLFCSQFQKRAASPQVISNAGQLAALGSLPVTE